MNMNSAPTPNKKNPTKEEQAVESRRNFLKGTVAVLAGAAIGGALVRNEVALNAFNEEFSPDASVEDVEKVLKASKLLREEILNSDTSTDIIINKSVRMIGTGHPNERIEILRNYIHRYLNSKHFPEISVESKVKRKIRETGKITVNDLDMLIADLKLPR